MPFEYRVLPAHSFLRGLLTDRDEQLIVAPRPVFSSSCTRLPNRLESTRYRNRIQRGYFYG